MEPVNVLCDLLETDLQLQGDGSWTGTVDQEAWEAFRALTARALVGSAA